MRRAASGLWVPDPLAGPTQHRPQTPRDARGHFVVRAPSTNPVGAGGGGGGGGGSTPANGNLFWSEWRNAPSTGCSFANNTDNGNWDLFVSPGGENICDVNNTLQVRSDISFPGGSGKSLRKEHVPGVVGDGGGGETIVYKTLSLGTQHYGYARMYFSGPMFFGPIHKWIIMGAGVSQDLYIEFSSFYTFPGDVGPDTSRGRIRVYFTTEDHYYKTTNLTFLNATWYEIEWHVNTSTGLFEMKVDGTALDWALEGTSTSLGTSMTRSMTGPYTYFKWSTYTNGSGDAAMQAAMPFYQSMGGCGIGNLGWIRGS